MAHYHTSKKDKAKRASSKTETCAVCHKPSVKARLKREPPGKGVLVHEGECREEQKKRNADKAKGRQDP